MRIFLDVFSIKLVGSFFERGGKSQSVVLPSSILPLLMAFPKRRLKRRGIPKVKKRNTNIEVCIKEKIVELNPEVSVVSKKSGGENLSTLVLYHSWSFLKFPSWLSVF